MPITVRDFTDFAMTGVRDVSQAEATLSRAVELTGRIAAPAAGGRCPTGFSGFESKARGAHA